MISVLLPYRNAAATVGEALESVLAQRDLGAHALEIIAVDDGSSDESRDVVAALARRDSRIGMVNAGGVGIARALSAGLAVARGELIARMDADDVSLPARFARQLALLATDPALAVVGVRVEGFPEIGPGLSAYLAWQNSVVSAREHAAALFIETPLCHPSTMIRRAALEAVGGFRDGPYPEDYDLWLRLDRAGHGLAKVDEILFRWRHGPGRATFNDPRCTPGAILELRATFLAERLASKPFAIWGAGKTGRRLARALERHHRAPDFFVDIDPDKIGRRAFGRPILAPAHIERDARAIALVVAVGARGARNIVRARLAGLGLTEGVDYVCAA